MVREGQNGLGAWSILLSFNFDELTSLFFGVAEVKFLSPEDAERIKAG